MKTSGGAPVITTAPTERSFSRSRHSSSSSPTIAVVMKLRGGLSSRATSTRPVALGVDSAVCHRLPVRGVRSTDPTSELRNSVTRSAPFHRLATRCAFSSSTATCCAGPARTSTTPSWPRRSRGSGTRCTCCARRPIPSSSGSSTRSAAGREDSWPSHQVRRPPHAGTLHGLPARHRRPAAGLRVRRLRGLRGAHVRPARRRGAGSLRRLERAGGARRRRAGGHRGGLREPRR